MPFDWYLQHPQSPSHDTHSLPLRPFLSCPHTSSLPLPFPEASGFSRLTTHTTVARESAAVGLLPSAAGGFAKAVSLSDLCLHITALVGLRTSVLELHSRALELRGQLERLVDQRLAAHEQEQQVSVEARVVE